MNWFVCRLGSLYPVNIQQFAAYICEMRVLKTDVAIPGSRQPDRASQEIDAFYPYVGDRLFLVNAVVSRLD